MTLSFLTESFEVRSSLIRTSSLDGTNTLYPAWIRRWPSFWDNEQQMKERFKIFWTRCIGKWSVYFSRLTWGFRRSVFLWRGCWRQRPSLSRWSTHTLILCRLRSIHLSKLRSIHWSSWKRDKHLGKVQQEKRCLRSPAILQTNALSITDLRSESTMHSNSKQSLRGCYSWHSWGIFKAHPSRPTQPVPEDSWEHWPGSPGQSRQWQHEQKMAYCHLSLTFIKKNS